MKILFVAPYLPSPPRFGGQRRLDGIMRGLARDHEVSVLSFNTSDQYAQESIDATKQFCSSVTTLADLDSRELRDKRKLQLRSMISLSSYERLQARRRTDFQQKIDEHLARGVYDVVQVEFANIATYRYRALGKRPVFVMDEHNIEYDLQKRTAGSSDGLSRRIYSELNWRKLGREERAAWRRFDGVVLTSTRDEQLLQRTMPGVRTAVVPNGVAVDQFVPSAAEPETERLLFFGANNYFPNHDGLLYFIDEILPKIVRVRPNVKLSIVGPGAQPAVLERQGPNVEIVGFVDDLMPHLERASLVVVPLRIGGGTRLKIVEAMAKAKAIVSTRIGAEGIDVKHEHDALLADTPEAFAEQVLRALAEPELARRLGQNARVLAERGYAWAAIVSRLERFYAELGAR